MIVDAHCHIDLYQDPFEVAQVCSEENLWVLSVTTTPSAWEGTLKLAGNGSKIKTAIGLHPQLAHERHRELVLFENILRNTRFVGEVGLDGAPALKKHYDKQIEVFRSILQMLDRSEAKVISIHSRYAASAVIDEIKGINGVPILHWFTGTKSELKKAVEIGCYFSFGPMQLSTNKGVELGKMVPRDRLLTETDGPFATSNRGLIYPLDIPSCYQTIAEIWGCSTSEVESQIESNLKHMLGQVGGL